MSKRAPRIALSVGCPCGVGPEVSVVAAARPAEGRGRILLVGDFAVLARAARARGIDVGRLVRVSRAEDGWKAASDRIAVWQPSESLAEGDGRPGVPTPAAGAAQLLWVNEACDLAARGLADALVTGPVSKEAIARSGARGARMFRGHTEHLQARLGAKEVVMAFWSPTFTTALATTHLPLRRVSRAITSAAVATATFHLALVLWKLGGRNTLPQLAVCGLNPHAGESGLLGTEEVTQITPGIAKARTRLRRAKVQAALHGPVPAESAFRLANAGMFEGVVAMYHDQATIPMKLVGFGEAVNVSLGLPIIRTSVDHGTAYDRAARFDADERGMVEAIRLAFRLGEVGYPGRGA